MATTTTKAGETVGKFVIFVCERISTDYRSSEIKNKHEKLPRLSSFPAQHSRGVCFLTQLFIDKSPRDASFVCFDSGSGWVMMPTNKLTRFAGGMRAKLEFSRYLSTFSNALQLFMSLDVSSQWFRWQRPFHPQYKMKWLRNHGFKFKDGVIWSEISQTVSETNWISVKTNLYFGSQLKIRGYLAKPSWKLSSNHFKN